MVINLNLAGITDVAYGGPALMTGIGALLVATVMSVPVFADFVLYDWLD